MVRAPLAETRKRRLRKDMRCRYDESSNNSSDGAEQELMHDSDGIKRDLELLNAALYGTQQHQQQPQHTKPDAFRRRRRDHHDHRHRHRHCHCSSGDSDLERCWPRENRHISEVKQTLLDIKSENHDLRHLLSERLSHESRQTNPTTATTTTTTTAYEELKMRYDVEKGAWEAQVKTMKELMSMRLQLERSSGDDDVQQRQTMLESLRHERSQRVALQEQNDELRRQLDEQKTTTTTTTTATTANESRLEQLELQNRDARRELQNAIAELQKVGDDNASKAAMLREERERTRRLSERFETQRLIYERQLTELSTKVAKAMKVRDRFEALCVELRPRAVHQYNKLSE